MDLCGNLICSFSKFEAWFDIHPKLHARYISLDYFLIPIVNAKMYYKK